MGEIQEAVKDEVTKYRDPRDAYIEGMQEKVSALKGVLTEQRKFKTKANKEIRRLTKIINGLESGKLVMKSDGDGNLYPPESYA